METWRVRLLAGEHTIQEQSHEFTVCLMSSHGLLAAQLSCSSESGRLGTLPTSLLVLTAFLGWSHTILCHTLRMQLSPIWKTCSCKIPTLTPTHTPRCQPGGWDYVISREGHLPAQNQTVLTHRPQLLLQVLSSPCSGTTCLPLTLFQAQPRTAVSYTQDTQAPVSTELCRHVFGRCEERSFFSLLSQACWKLERHCRGWELSSSMNLSHGRVTVSPLHLHQ